MSGVQSWIHLTLKKDSFEKKLPSGFTEEQSGAVEACWAHNPEVRGSKPRSANVFLQNLLPGIFYVWKKFSVRFQTRLNFKLSRFLRNLFLRKVLIKVRQKVVFVIFDFFLDKFYWMDFEL